MTPEASRVLDQVYFLVKELPAETSENTTG
jgi:hypothetical protein